MTTLVNEGIRLAKQAMTLGLADTLDEIVDYVKHSPAYEREDILGRMDLIDGALRLCWGEVRNA